MDPVGASRAESTGVLRELIYAADRYRQAMSEHSGLSVNENVAMSRLYHGGDLDQTELARLVGITSSSATTLVDRLTERGMVRRVPDPHDRRRWLVRMTTSGRRMWTDFTTWFGRALDEIDDDALPEVTEALRMISKGLRIEADRLQALPPRTQP